MMSLSYVIILLHYANIITLICNCAMLAELPCGRLSLHYANTIILCNYGMLM